MDRRDTIVALLALGMAAGPRASRAQANPSTQAKTLAVLAPGSSQDVERFFLGVFRPELKALGWIEGQNLVVEGAFADYKYERLPALAEDLVRKRVDVVWATTAEAAIAAARATKSIPIVFTAVPWPVETGLTVRQVDFRSWSRVAPATSIRSFAARAPPTCRSIDRTNTNC